MVAGFEPPPGEGGTISAAASAASHAGSDLKADLGKANTAAQKALTNWRAKRADTFREGMFGIQAQLGALSAGATEVSTVLTAYASAWKTCDHEIDGYRTEAERLQRELDQAKPEDDPLTLQAKRLRIEALRDDAEDSRKRLKTLGDQLASGIDGQTNKLVPNGATMSPDAIRRAVDHATGVTGTKGAAGDPWSVLGKATAQGKHFLDLEIDNKDGEKAGGPVTSLPTDPDLLKLILDAARIDGVAPKRYAGALQQYWVAVAAKKAGIDLNAWDPSKGADGNRSTISAVYTYYGSLFKKDPKTFQWAGMANMIGPSFAGGFLDINEMKRIAAAISAPGDAVPDWAKGLLPAQLQALTGIANLGENELGWYEQKFLAMQKKIFFDQAAMHEAYLGGSSADKTKYIREMQQAGLIDQRANDAWKDISSGRPDLVQRGNENLLWREQNQIINKQYDQMRDHNGPEGQAFTYLMTAIGAASIPGTKTPGQYKPWSFTIDAPSTPVIGGDASVTVHTPLPDFNISDREARWKYITEDTLPAYQKLLRDDPDEAMRIISSDVDGRVDDQRLIHRAPTIIKNLATDWDVDVHAGVHVGPFHVGF